MDFLERASKKQKVGGEAVGKVHVEIIYHNNPFKQ